MRRPYQLEEEGLVDGVREVEAVQDDLADEEQNEQEQRHHEQPALEEVQARHDRQRCEQLDQIDHALQVPSFHFSDPEADAQHFGEVVGGAGVHEPVSDWQLVHCEQTQECHELLRDVATVVYVKAGDFLVYGRLYQLVELDQALVRLVVCRGTRRSALLLQVDRHLLLEPLSLGQRLLLSARPAGQPRCSACCFFPGPCLRLLT